MLKKIVNYLRASSRGIGWKIILNSGQASEHLNLDYRVKFFLVVAFISLTSCNEDESRICVTCRNAQTPDFELCRESNGNASVNGEDTGVDFDIQLADLEALGTICGS